MKKFTFLFLLIFAFPVMLSAQEISTEDFRSKVRDYRAQNESQIIDELVTFLSIPNVTSDVENIQRNAEHIKGMLEKRGISARIMETGGRPVVFGELNVPGATTTIMFYAHYDGQPVDLSKWIDQDPFEPVLRKSKMEAGSTTPKPVPFPRIGKYEDDWRIYARSASDDRCPITAILAGMDAVKSMGLNFGSNLKFIFEGEEETSSPNLRSFSINNREMIAADVLYVCDGPVYYNNKPTLKFGARGITTINLTVYGPNTNVHSGHYGNWVPNPGMKLSKLLAGMKDEVGNVLVEGFYDTSAPLGSIEKQALRDIPPFDGHLMELYGFSEPEGGGKSLMELINRPSLNIRGMQSAWIGSQARTVVPTEATAAIDIRMVKGNEPSDMVNKVKKHIEQQGYYVTSREPNQETRMKYPNIARVTGGGGYPASRTEMDLPISKKTIDALEKYFGEKPVLIPTSGGSVPLYIFTRDLELPTISVPIVNHDNNQHQANENIRIGHYYTGIETFAAILYYVR
ncbi:M20/M25/M40 family metallo-hydrolase [candidate division KSB1 bacterium]